VDALLEGDAETAEFGRQPPAVGGVDHQVGPEQLGLELGGRAGGDHFAPFDDPDVVGLLGLVQVVGGEEDRHAVLGPRLGQVLPEVATAGGVEADARLVEEEHPGPVHQAAHDLQLALHAAGEGLHGFAQFARDAEQGGELLDLIAVGAGHGAEGRAERVEPVEHGVEADVLLGREVLVQTRFLEDDADLAPHRRRPGRQVVAGDADAATGRGEGGGQDGDGRRLAGAVGAEQGEEGAGRDVEADAVDGVGLGALVALDQVADLDDRGHGRGWTPALDGVTGTTPPRMVVAEAAGKVPEVGAAEQPRSAGAVVRPRSGIPLAQGWAAGSVPGPDRSRTRRRGRSGLAKASGSVWALLGRKASRYEAVPGRKGDRIMDDRIARRGRLLDRSLSRRGLLGRSLATGGGALAAGAFGPGLTHRKHAAAATAQEGQASGKLVSWGYGTENPVAAARVEAFQKAYPDVELEVVPTLEDEKLLTAVASDSVPDLLWLDRFSTAGWASREVLLPLAEYIERDEFDTSRFYESALAEASWDGQVYGVPGGMDLRVLYVNLDALGEAGVDAAGLDTANWEQLNEVGAQLVQRDGDQVRRWGFDNKLGSGFIYLWGTGNGGSFMNEDGTETTFDDEKNVDALAWGVKTFEDQGGYQSYEAFASTFQGDEQFARGLVALTMYENWMLGIVARVAPDLDFAVLPVRQRGGADPVSFTGGRAWYIPNGAKNPEAAWEFIKFMHTDETWLIGAEAVKAARRAANQPYIPSLTGSKTADQLQIERVYEPIAPKFDEAVKLFPRVLEKSRVREISISPVANLLHEALMTQGVLPALQKEKAPPAAMADADAAAQEAINSF
jgi:multiple sugar transport system substrate-binding protein